MVCGININKSVLVNSALDKLWKANNEIFTWAKDSNWRSAGAHAISRVAGVTSCVGLAAINLINAAMYVSGGFCGMAEQLCLGNLFGVWGKFTNAVCDTGCSLGAMLVLVAAVFTTIFSPDYTINKVLGKDRVAKLKGEEVPKEPLS